MDEDVDARERIFHHLVRDYILGLLLFILLYVVSYVTICAFKRNADREDDYSVDDAGDAVVYRISLWLCTFTLAVSGGAVLLLPISILANEALIMFPGSYYLQWINSSLLHGLWNSIFLCSNVSMFMLMPFAYFFTESEGLPGSRRGIRSRVCEASLVLTLLFILVWGLFIVFSAILNNDNESRLLLFDIWTFYLPYQYSCISLLGVVMLLICTPIGFVRLFTVMGVLVSKPKFLQNLDGELQVVLLEEETLNRWLSQSLGHESLLYTASSSSSSTPLPAIANGNGHGNHGDPASIVTHRRLDQGTSQYDLKMKLTEVQKTRRDLERRQQVSPLRRNLLYPVVMLLLVFLMSVTVLLVGMNVVELLTGLKALPVGSKELVLGISSLSALGFFGAIIEITIILYLMLTSVIGFYSLPLVKLLRPRCHDTPMTKIIGNCVVILVLSSALPVLSRTLGITNFDLLGNFGRLQWLGNLHIILSYNFIFAVVTLVCIVTKFTATVRATILDHFGEAYVQGRQRLRRRGKLWSAIFGGDKMID